MNSSTHKALRELLIGAALLLAYLIGWLISPMRWEKTRPNSTWHSYIDLRGGLWVPITLLVDGMFSWAEAIRMPNRTATAQDNAEAYGFHVLFVAFISAMILTLLSLWWLAPNTASQWWYFPVIYAVLLFAFYFLIWRFDSVYRLSQTFGVRFDRGVSRPQPRSGGIR